MKSAVQPALGLGLLLGAAALAFAAGEAEQGAAGQETLTIMARFPTSFVEEDNVVIQYVEERTGIDLSFDVPPLESFTERQQLALAAGDLPDVMQWTNNLSDPLLLDAVDEGVVLPVTAAVQRAPNIQRYTNPITWPAMQLKNDADYYAIPGNTVVRADGYFVREDWLENVGFELSRPDHSVTLDEFTEILRRFTEEDPDGNGRDDTHGLGVAAAGGGNLFLAVSWPFGLGRDTGRDWWQKVEGEPYPYMPLKYSRSKDNLRRALEYNRMLFEERYIDPNWPTNTGSTRNERVFSGIAGMRSSFGGHVMFWLDSVKKNIPAATATYITGIIGDDGTARGPGYGTGLYRTYTVHTDGKQDTAAKFFDWLLSDEGFDLLKFGMEDVHFTMDGNRRTFTEEYGNFTFRTWLALVRRYNDPTFFIEQTTPPEQMSMMVDWINTTMANVAYSEDFGFRPPVASEQYFIDAKNDLNVAISRIIAGQLPVSAYRDALDEWYENGGEEYLRQVNDYIASR